MSFGIDYEMLVVSAHRTPDRLVKVCKGLKKKLRVIIAGAEGGGTAFTCGCINNWSTC